MSALLALSGGAIVTSAANQKSFTAVMTSGSSLVRGGTYKAGVQYSSLAITITNTSLPESGSINLGSANIIPPGNGVVILNPASGVPAVPDDPTACFTLSGGAAAGASACYITGTTTIGGVTTTGPVIALRNLSLPSSTSVKVTFPARVACDATTGSATWPIAAKQSNDFNAQPGNDLSIDPPNGFPTSTVGGSCHLVFTGQPAPALKNAVITSQNFTPGGNPVQVTVATGTTTTADPVLFGSFTITLTKGAGPGAISGDLGPTTTTGGVATFAPRADAVGTYTLAASDGANVTGATSNPFVIVDVAVECGAGNPCSSGPQSASRSTVDVSTTNSNGGFATVAFNPSGTENLCLSGTAGSDVFDVNITQSVANKTVRITIQKAFVTKAANKYQVCVQFSSGEVVLPNCTAAINNVPCVLSRSTVKGSVEIVFLLPPGDPPAKAW
jgi:hypothetical protein